MQEAREVIELSLHVGVPETCIAFAAAPEGVALAAELVGHFKRLLHLRGGVGKDIGVRAGRGAVHEARVCKQAGGSPEQLDARALLFFLEDLDDRVEVLVRFREGCPSGATSRSWNA